MKNEFIDLDEMIRDMSKAKDIYYLRPSNSSLSCAHKR